MKRKFSPFTIIVVLAINLTLNACDQPQTIGDQITSKASLTPTTISTSQPPKLTSPPSPTQTPTPQPFSENIDLPECILDEQQDEFMKNDNRYESDFAEMDSYRYRAIYRYKSGEEYAEDEMSIEIKGAHSSLKNESEVGLFGFLSGIYRRSNIILTDLHSLTQSETILTEDGVWFQTSDDSGWIELPQSKPSPVMNFAELYSPLASFFVRGPYPPDMKMMKRTESIDGIDVTHRCFKPEQYEDADEPFNMINYIWPHSEGVFTGYQDTEIHFWTSQDDSHLLRLAIIGKEIVEIYSDYGNIEHDPPNDFLFWLELSDIDQPIEIIPPSSEDVSLKLPDKNIIQRLDVDAPYNQLPIPPDAELVSDSENKWLKEVESNIEEFGITPETAVLFRPREFMIYLNEFEYFLFDEKYHSYQYSIPENLHPIYETDMDTFSLIRFFTDNMSDLGWILDDAVLELLGDTSKLFLFFHRDNIILPIILEDRVEKRTRIEAFLPTEEMISANNSEWISYTELNSEWGTIYNYQTLVVDNSGRAWIGYMEADHFGLSSFVDGKWTNYTDVDPGMSGHLLSMAVDKSGRVWIGTKDGLIIFDGESWSAFSDDSPDFMKVSDILVDDENNIWISSEGGIHFYDGNNWATYAHQFKDVSLYLDNEGQPWITILNGGLYSLDGDRWIEHISPFPSPNFSPEHHITKIDFDSNGRIWILSPSENIISMYNGDEIEPIDFGDTELQFSLVSDLVIDQFDRIWIRDMMGVFMRDTDGDWKDFTPQYTGISLLGTEITIDNQGHIWIGSADGVTIYSPPIP